MRFQSPWIAAKGTASQIFALLSHADNLKQLMPEQVVNWRGDAETCSFTIKGMTELSLQVAERTPDRLIRLAPLGKQAFPFDLQIAIRETPLCGEACFQINAELNPFIEMIAKRPLQHLVDYMADRVPFLKIEV